MKLKVIEKIRKIFQYSKLLWKDYDYDYGFLLELERLKLKNMQEYFKNANITESEWEHYRDITIALKCLDIIQEKDTIYDYSVTESGSTFSLKPNVYVNIRNAKRFVNDSMLESLNINENMKTIISSDIRIEKAWNLYSKIRTEKTRDWWD